MTQILIDYSKGGHRITVERCERPVVARLEETEIARTDSALLLRETGYPPVHYIPIADVADEYLEKSDTITTCPFKGHAMYYSIMAGGKEHSDAAWRYLDAFPEFSGIKDFVAFYSNTVDVREE